MKNFYIAKSRRLRGTKYTSRVEKQGVTSYTVYNHMLLPASFGSIESLYHHLKEDVQVWDAAVQRQLEISGKDSSKLVQMMTCRDLSKAKEGRCYYCPIIDNKGGIINDPVVLKLSDEKNNIIGDLRSGCYNPTFKQVIGIAMVKKPYFEASQTFKIDINGKSFDGTVCDLPFI